MAFAADAVHVSGTSSVTFDEFVQRFGKVYSPEEREIRRAVFEDNKLRTPVTGRLASRNSLT
jgi:hypothetical protein